MTDAEPTVSENSLMIPESLEKSYELRELITERPGIWTLAVQRKSDGKKCVAKLFRGVMRENGKREADILGSLDHPDIPKLVTYFEEGGTGVLIREYAEGKPLDQYIAERVITEPAIISIGMKICRVLAYLHGLPEPVIHRDIKPQNIIVDDNGGIKLIDFGISRFRNEQNPVDTVFAGTAAYAPPEQYGFRQTDQRADIYSLGMVLQYMLTGSVDTASDKKGTEGSRLRNIIGKCTSFAPEKRYRNIQELYKSLAAVNRGSLPLAVTAGLMAVCLVVGGVLGFLAEMTFGRSAAASRNRMPVTPLSAMLGLNDMTEEQLLGITGIFIYGDTVFDTLYTKNAADSSGEKTEVNSYISGHPYIIAFKSGPIEISDGDINDISCLKYLKNLKQLVIARNRIWDLSPLEELTRLEFLDLSCNPITDISSLRSLTSLRKLYLNGCSAKDLSPVYGLSALEALYVSDNGISGINGVAGLKNLKAIDLQSNGLIDVSALGKLTGLEQIFLGYNRIQDLSFLSSLNRNKVVDLQISGNPITDTSPLTSGQLFDKSRSVHVAADYLGTVVLSFLRDIDTFRELRLEGTDCSHLSQYVSGKQIEWLIINDSGINDISWLETVTGTWRMDIARNPGIKDLSVLKQMSSLQVVCVSEDMRPLTEVMADDVSFSFCFV